DMAEVPLDRARAEEEQRPDLGIRAPVPREGGDLRLLGRELPARVVGSLARRRSGREQLARRASGESFCSDPDEEVMRLTARLAGVGAPGCAPEPLAVHQLRAR